MIVFLNALWASHIASCAFTKTFPQYEISLPSCLGRSMIQSSPRNISSGRRNWLCIISIPNTILTSRVRSAAHLTNRLGRGREEEEQSKMRSLRSCLPSGQVPGTTGTAQSPRGCSRSASAGKWIKGLALPYPSWAGPGVSQLPMQHFTLWFTSWGLENFRLI